jgi:ferrous iron transport protein B
MDRILRKFGLSGKSIIPMLVATGCGVPGILASRTIEQERDRKITVMTTGFIPCGAKMPIIGMIAGSMFGDNALASSLISVAAYFIGVGAVVISGIILKKLKAFAGAPAPFVMELPAYHAPLASNIFRTTWDRGWSFIKRAGSVIFVASVVIWFLNNLSFAGGFHFITEDRGGNSILELVGSWIAWIFIPLGFGNWQSAVATILGLMAKEEVVGAFGAMAGSESGLYDYVSSAVFGGSALAAFSFMIFNLLCAPCFGAMGAIKREMNNSKWTAFAIAYMCVFAYATCFCVYQIGSLVSGAFYWWEALTAAIALVIIGGALYLLLRKDPSLKGTNKKV